MKSYDYFPLFQHKSKNFTLREILNIFKFQVSIRFLYLHC